MNPLNAQQISRIEHSESFKQASQKEATSFITTKRKPWQFITKLFRTKKEDPKRAVNKRPSLEAGIRTSSKMNSTQIIYKSREKQ